MKPMFYFNLFVRGATPVCAGCHTCLCGVPQFKDVLKILETSSASYLGLKQSSTIIISQTILMRLSLEPVVITPVCKFIKMLSTF